MLENPSSVNDVVPYEYSRKQSIRHEEQGRVEGRGPGVLCELKMAGERSSKAN